MLAISLILCSCGDKGQNSNEVLYFLKDMKSCSSDVKIYINNDKQSLTYSGRQYFVQGTGYQLILENQRIYTFKDNKVIVKDLKNNAKYSLEDSSKDIMASTFRMSFVSEYVSLLYTDENIKCSFEKLDNNTYEIIDITIPGDNKNMSRAVLYVNVNDKIPWKSKIFNDKNEETAEITYSNFKANTQIDGKLFDVK